MKKIMGYSLIGLLISIILSFYFGYIEVGCILIVVTLTILNAFGRVASIDNQIRIHNSGLHQNKDRHKKW